MEAGPGERAGRAGVLEGMELTARCGVGPGGLPVGGEVGLCCGHEGAVWSFSEFLGPSRATEQLILLGFHLGVDSCLQQTEARIWCG